MTHVLEEVEINATGPKVLVATMTVLFSDSYDAMKAWKENLKAINIRKYPAEDVGKCCTDITTLSEPLKSTGHINPDCW